MNYWKLTLSVAGGILIAALIAGVFVGVQDYLRAKRLREAYLRVEGSSVTGENAFVRARKAVGSDPDKIPAAASTYCTETAWAGAAPERKQQLWLDCVRETSRHLAEEMK